MPVHDEGVYGRNPARDVETIAVRTLTAWVGERGTVTDQSDGPGPDFAIDYADGRTGIGEVGWHEDEAVAEAWAAVFKQKHHHLVPLAPGLGRWSAMVARAANVNALHRGLPDLIRDLTAAGLTSYTDQQGSRPDPLTRRARSLRVKYVSRIQNPDGDLTMDSDSGDDALPEDWVLYVFDPGTDSELPSDLDLIAGWISEVLADPDYADTSAKVLAIDADERHVFMMSGSRTPHGVQHLLSNLDQGVPHLPPQVPEGISHVWVLGRYGSTALVWTAAEGWSHVLAANLFDD